MLPQKMFFAMIFSCVLFSMKISCLSVFNIDGEQISKRAVDADIQSRIDTVGNLVFDTNVLPEATKKRHFRILFVFDKEASADLRDKTENAEAYAKQLTRLTSQYTAHANIQVSSAAVELWSSGDKISFDTSGNPRGGMPGILENFQEYLKKQHGNNFGKIYSIGVLISNKNRTVAGGFANGPPCATTGAIVMHYRPIPWVIAGLLGHEMAHTLGVVHPTEISWHCEDGFPLSFCKASKISDNCLCASKEYPAEQCLMTSSFGRASKNAPRYTLCEIETMNYFTPNATCLDP